LTVRLEVYVDVELELLLVELEDVDVEVAVGVVVLKVEEVVELLVLEDENKRNPPIATMTIITTAPITAGVDTPRLVRMSCQD